MVEKRWKRSSTAVYNVSYHIIWCTKYRRKLLVDDIASRLKELLAEKAAELGIEIKTMEGMPEHVHLFIKASPADAPQFLIGQLKGYSSRLLNEEFPALRTKLPSLWTRSYYCESVGRLSEGAVKRYIESQKSASQENKERIKRAFFS